MTNTLQQAILHGLLGRNNRVSETSITLQAKRDQPGTALAQVVYSIEREVKAAHGWQPIDTAPKDGTEVLCWREDCGQFIASYTSPDAFPLTQSEIDQMDEKTLFTRDWFTQWPQALRLEGGETPTHFMPLPPPPEVRP